MSLIAGCGKKDDAIPQAEKKDTTKGVAAPNIAETKAIAEEGFIYGLPLVMNYAVMNEFAVDTKSSQFKAPFNAINNQHNNSPPPVANDLRRFDNTGNLQRPIIIGHGSHDPIVSPGETVVYKKLVEDLFGVAGARDLLAVYFIPGMGMAVPSTTLHSALSSMRSRRGSIGTRAAVPPDLRLPTY